MTNDPIQPAEAIGMGTAPSTPPAGLETLFEALDRLAPAPDETPADGLEPGARKALEQQTAWEDRIQSEHEQMRFGQVIALPGDRELDKLRLLRGMDALAGGSFPPEQQRAVAQHLKDVVDRLAGQPVLKRGQGPLLYR